MGASPPRRRSFNGFHQANAKKRSHPSIEQFEVDSTSQKRKLQISPLQRAQSQSRILEPEADTSMGLERRLDCRGEVWRESVSGR